MTLKNTPKIKYKIKERLEKLPYNEFVIIKAKGHIILGVSKRTMERDLEGIYTISGERIEKWAKLLRCKTSVLFHKGVTDINLSASIKKMGLIR